MEALYRVFWQPGCSSCLKAKEFLSSHGIDFDSVNVLADEQGFEDLQKLGARSVPVVSRGSQFVFAQNLNDVAEFVGVKRDAVSLSSTELVARLGRVLEVAISHAQKLPDDVMAVQLPGRDRSYLDLSYHIFVIAEAFLEAAGGGTLTYDFFERRPPAHICDGEGVAAFGKSIQEAIEVWWAAVIDSHSESATLLTYYGPQTLPDLLERTAWHAAQHTRQLEAVLRDSGVIVDDMLTDADLQGLPLPEHVYDDEVPLSGTTR